MKESEKDHSIFSLRSENVCYPLGGGGGEGGRIACIHIGLRLVNIILSLDGFELVTLWVKVHLGSNWWSNKQTLVWSMLVSL